MSFGTPFYNHQPEEFPGGFSDISSLYLVAPFWSDVDIRRDGAVFYEIHSESNAVMEQVSAFVSDYTGDDFQGSWMLVAQWDRVHPYPAGLSQATIDFLESIFGPYGDLDAVSLFYNNNVIVFID